MFRQDLIVVSRVAAEGTRDSSMMTRVFLRHFSSTSFSNGQISSDSPICGKFFVLSSGFLCYNCVELMKKKKEVITKISHARACAAGIHESACSEIVKNYTNAGPVYHAAIDQARRCGPPARRKKKELGEYSRVIVDTSVLIDGRILPIVNSGFISGTFIIPRFILGELQHIADSDDSLRRAKGRRGLEIVNTLKDQKVNSFVYVKFVDAMRRK